VTDSSITAHTVINRSTTAHTVTDSYLTAHLDTQCRVGTHLDKQVLEDDNKYIVILDNIHNSVEYQDSKAILREVNRNKPTLNVYHAYPLPGGGICLHLQSAIDVDHALDDWPSGAFQSEAIYPHLPACRSDNITVIARNVNTYATEHLLEHELATAYNQPVFVKRFRNRQTGKPIPVISVKFGDNQTTSQVITNGLLLQGKTIPCEPKRANKVIRCFKCQKFGHVARNCKHIDACITCGCDHSPEQDCTNILSCANCKGNHRADNNQCPVYIAIRSKLVQRTVIRTCSTGNTEYA
jgi:hypothetical protein